MRRNGGRRRRLIGRPEDPAHVAALARFLDTIPRVPIAPPVLASALDHDKARFESPDLVEVQIYVQSKPMT